MKKVYLIAAGVLQILSVALTILLLTGQPSVLPPAPPLGGICDQLYFSNMAIASGEFNAALSGRTVRVYCDIQVDGRNWLVQRVAVVRLTVTGGCSFLVLLILVDCGLSEVARETFSMPRHVISRAIT